MRALILLFSIGILALTYALGSFTGLLIAAALCAVVVALSFVFSTSRSEAGESGRMRRALGRNTTFLAGLRKH